MPRTIPLISLLALLSCGEQRPPPNIIYILADDLGYGELGSYGQDKIRTPNLDRLAAEGMRFTEHYAGSPVCAPSRDTILTGYHTGHAYIRDNDEMDERGDVWNDPDLEGQRPLLAGTVTIGTLLQDAGYVTAAIGKWGLGWVGSSGDPNEQGFDHFYGYICQRIAHNYYPTHLWRNGEKVRLDNEDFSPRQKLPEGADPTSASSYEGYSGRDYAMDFLTEEALAFVIENRSRPFFLYLPYVVPHLALQVPGDSLAEYENAFDEEPYLGDNGYLPHPKPRAAYAAMITRMDRDIGRLLELLDALGLAENTVVMFSSDNGPSWVGGVDRAFFESTGGLRGRKAELYEGGIRVPLIARWPGHIEAGAVSDRISASWDLLPTFTELAQARTPDGIDGLSLLPTLTGNELGPVHDYLYWEFQGEQAIRRGRFKAIRHGVNEPTELYDLLDDPAESIDVASEHPDIVREMLLLFSSARVESELFPLS
ncbi:MAG: N-acetylgalactosamine-6-sulfatase [Acidobacteria bacterium]|nr:MAG: N-acetylgalactosamine-6-sulfatase [Acidobacteriota bacterium]